jgi:hypothetical protein
MKSPGWFFSNSPKTRYSTGAVDGMSTDLVPVEEDGRLNAFMSFGKAVMRSRSNAPNRPRAASGSSGAFSIYG